MLPSCVSLVHSKGLDSAVSLAKCYKYLVSEAPTSTDSELQLVRFDKK